MEKFRTTLLVVLLAGILILALFLPRIESSQVNVEDAATVTMWSVRGFSFSSLFPFLRHDESDLEIRIVDAGYMQNGTDTIVRTANAGARGAIRVMVSNVGNERTGVWHLIAKLPTEQVYTYISEAQAPIAPGEKKIFLLTFDDLSKSENRTAVLRIEMLDGTEKDVSNNTAQYDFSEIQ